MLEVLNAFFNPVAWLIAVLVAGLAALTELRNEGVKRAIRFVDLKSFKPAITSSTHALHAGGISDYYLNLDYLSTVPSDSVKITNWYVEAVEKLSSEENVEGLAFIDKDSGPVGAIALLGGIIAQTNLPSIIVRLKKRTIHGKISGRPEVLKQLSAGANVVIVTDVITAAETVKGAIDAVTEFGAKVSGVCTLLDRRIDFHSDICGVPVLQWATESDLKDENLIKSKPL